MNRSLPTLADSRTLRLAAFALLYAAQGVPYGLLTVALPAYLAERDLTPAEIGGFVGIALLPWSLKLVLGPVMDRWSFLAMGRRRPWVLAAQVGIAVSFVALALLPDPLHRLAWLTALGFTVNFFTAFQDVATDGMAIDVLPLEEQARANGFMWGGQTLGIAGATAGGAWVLDAYGFGPAMLASALVVGLVGLVPLLLRERPGERVLPWSAGAPSPAAAQQQAQGWRDIGRSLLRALALPGSLFAIAAFFVYRVGHGLMEATLPVLTVQRLGWEDTDFSEISATARLVAGVLAMAVGGLLVERVGRVRAVSIGCVLVLAATLAMGLLPALWALGPSVPAFIVGYTVVDTLLMVALLATAMALCWRRVAATQYALYMAVGNLGLSTGAALLGPVQAVLGFPPLFLAIGGACGLTLALVRFVHLERHHLRIGTLDAATPAPPGAALAGGGVTG